MKWMNREPDRLARFRLRLGHVVTSIGSLFAGTLASQLVLLTASLVLARLYSPSDFGILAISMAFSSILATVTVFSYPTAVPLAKTNAAAKNLTWLSMILGIVLSILAGAVALLSMALSRSETLWGLDRPVIVLTCLSAAALTVWTASRAYLARIGDFRTVSVAAVSGNITQSTAQIVGGILHLAGAGLVFGFLLGRLSSSWRMIRATGLGMPRGLGELARSARTWRKPAFMLTVPAVLNLVSVGAVAPLIASLGSTALAGSFALATRILTVPSALLGQSVATVLYPEAAERERDGKASTQLIWKINLVLLLAGLPIFATVLLFGPELFSLIFGEEWRTAGVIAAILAPWLALNLASSAISSFATVKERFGVILTLSAVEAALRFGALTLGFSLGSDLLAVALYSAAGAVISISWIVWVLRQSGCEWGRITRLTTTCLAVIGALSLLAVATTRGNEGWILVISLAVIACATVVAVTWLTREARQLLTRQIPD